MAFKFEDNILRGILRAINAKTPVEKLKDSDVIQTISTVSKELGATKRNFIETLSDRLRDINFDPKIDWAWLAKFAKKVGDDILISALKYRISPKMDQEIFGEVTTTANVAQYPIPLGTLRKKNPLDKKDS